MPHPLHTIYPCFLRFICILILFTVQLDITGPVVLRAVGSNCEYTDPAKGAEGNATEKETGLTTETYYRCGPRIAAAFPPEFSLFVPALPVIRSTYISPVTAARQLNIRPPHAIYCVYLI